MMEHGGFFDGRERAFFFVDRINGGIATLLAEGAGEGEVSLPAELLPAGTSEGDYLSALFQIDTERRASARADIESLLSDLGDNP